MSTSKTEKNHVFSDKRGQDRRQDAVRALKFKNNRRKADRRSMDFSDMPWWLQRNYVNVSLSPVPSKPKNRINMKRKLKVD
jgi:hypothetical protein